MAEPVEPQVQTPEVAPIPGGFLEKMSRRNFLFLCWSAFLGFIASGLAATARFMFPNVLYEPSQRFKAGHLEDFPMGVSLKWVKDQRVWIVRTEKGVYALWARCTHLGCTPNWFQAEKRFRCPCHGSNFNMDGDVIAGPAPIPLWRVEIQKTPTGELIVNKAVKQNRPGIRDKGNFIVEA